MYTIIHAPLFSFHIEGVTTHKTHNFRSTKRQHIRYETKISANSVYRLSGVCEKQQGKKDKILDSQWLMIKTWNEKLSIVVLTNLIDVIN
jgi:hypothetical protein